MKQRHLALFALVGFISRVSAQSLVATDLALGDFGDMDLAQLAKIRIVSVSQRSEVLKDAPAAVRVVTSEEIARSGATSIPEALRQVPGLNVAQINGGEWAIGARGFQNQFANKLLVMVDGVSVYSSVNSGVFWDRQNYLLPDLEQIEVVLGPGGSIWGANAVNGVINVITKSARDTQGGLVYAGTGTEQGALTGARYGWQVGTNTYARIYGMYDYRYPTEKIGGGEAGDASQFGQGGFRLDGYPSAATEWTWKGDVHWNQQGSIYLQPDVAHPPYLTNREPIRALGGQMMGHWQTELNPDSTLQLQGSYDYSEGDTASGNIGVHTVDGQLHHTWTGWRRQVIDWGVGTRLVELQVFPGALTIDADHNPEWLGSGFVQDEITLVEDRLKFTGGFKLERHSTGGWLPQPNARLTWQPAEAHTFWAAWSQALRSPQAVELYSQFNLAAAPGSPFPRIYRYTGNPQLQPEQLTAWELGWRWQARPDLTLDAASYFYQYDQLILVSPGTPYFQPSPAAVVIPFVANNGTRGEAYGGELALTWRPTDRWQAAASYSLYHLTQESYAPDALNFAGRSRITPRQSIALTSTVKLSQAVDLTGALRYLDNLSYYKIPAYFELDLRLAWHPSANWEVALVGQNLLHDHHPEYRASLMEQSAEIQRGVYAKVTWRF